MTAFCPGEVARRLTESFSCVFWPPQSFAQLQEEDRISASIVPILMYPARQRALGTIRIMDRRRHQYWAGIGSYRLAGYGVLPVVVFPWTSWSVTSDCITSKDCFVAGAVLSRRYVDNVRRASDIGFASRTYTSADGATPPSPRFVLCESRPRPRMRIGVWGIFRFRSSSLGKRGQLT